ncbi:growth hormone-regulated TBC protein 1 isoform X2 [Lepidochelys kempii]|uniref:growth hormone-regulated TBC protein 1 isoform X2 n=1 Tax=Lepidochelys kempii TaxID=8472 RepID=UPI003C705747
MAKSSARLQLELAKFQAEEKQREHERQIELMQLKKEQEREAEQHQEAAHKREMEARKHVEEEREKERKHVEEEKEKERKHVEEMERIKAQQNIPTNPSDPSPGTTSHPRKFPTYKAGDDTEAFLENFERACLGYNISTDQYMVELRPQLSGPLAEVAAEMPKEHMNKYELFKSKARVRMGITPEQSRRRFRALRWKPDMSFTRHAYHIVKHWDAWISGASVESPVNLPFLMQMEQFLEGVPEEIERYILDGKPKTVIEAGEIGARWVEVAEKKKTGRSWSGDQKGPPQTTPYYRGPPKAPPTSQRTLQTPYRPTTPFSSNPPRPSDPSAGRCFKCNELGHVKANCPKNPNRLQFIAPESHQRSTGPDTSQIPLERRETVSVGGKKVTAWRDTGAQVSAIHASLVDPNLINPEIQVTIQPFKSNSFNLPTAKLPVQYKGWSGMWTFAVYDDYPIPMLLGEDLANHVKQAKRVGMVTRNQAKQAVRPSSVPETSIRTQSEVMDLDPRPMSATAVVDPVPETQTEPVPEPEPAEQPTPDPVSALNPILATSTPEGPTEPELAAADNPTQEAQPEPESQHSAPAESGSQSTETAPSPISLPEGPSLGPQSHEELMSPASREQFQTEQEADESLQRAWTAARSNPPPLSSSNRSRELKVCQFTAQGGDDAEWPEGVYYEGKCAGGVEEVNLSMTLGRMQRQQIQELCTSYAPTFSATPGLTERAYHSIDTDMNRTFPDNVQFRKTADPCLQQTLYNVLVAYGHHNKTVGYCQGMNFIAGYLILITKNEEESFWLLDALIGRILPDYYSPEMMGLKTDQEVLGELVRKKVPAVAELIDRHGVMWTLIVSRWFICLFIDILPVETVLRIWDCLFYEGSKIIFRVALALIKQHQAFILEATNLPDVCDKFKQITRGTFVTECHSFMQGTSMQHFTASLQAQCDTVWNIGDHL